MKERWSKEGYAASHVIRPFHNWRCRAWLVDSVWKWEARRFGRFQLHVSGECERLDHAKKIAVAAAAAVRGSWL